MTVNEAIVKYLMNRVQGNSLIEAVHTIEGAGFRVDTCHNSNGKREVFCEETRRWVVYNKKTNDFYLSASKYGKDTVPDKCNFEAYLNTSKRVDNDGWNDRWRERYEKSYRYRRQHLEWLKDSVKRQIGRIRDEQERFERYLRDHNEEMIRRTMELQEVEQELAEFRAKVGLAKQKPTSYRDILK